LIHNFFYLVKNSSLQARTCIYVNKHLKLDQWAMKIIESNICLIKLQTSNLKNKIQMLQLINVYNSCSLSIIFTEESFTISRLNKLIKDDCKLDWLHSVKYSSSSQVLDLKSVELNWKIFELESRQVEKLNSRTWIELKSLTQQLNLKTWFNSTRY